MFITAIFNKILQLLRIKGTRSRLERYNEAVEQYGDDYNAEMNILFEEIEQGFCMVDHEQLHNEIIEEFFIAVERCKQLEQENNSTQSSSNEHSENNDDPEITKLLAGVSGNTVKKIYDEEYDSEQVKEEIKNQIDTDAPRVYCYCKTEEYKKYLNDFFKNCATELSEKEPYIQGMDRFFSIIFYSYYNTMGELSKSDIKDCWQLVVDKFFVRYNCNNDYKERLDRTIASYLSFRYKNFNKGEFSGDATTHAGYFMKYFAQWFIDESIFDISNQLELFIYLLVASSYEPIIMFVANYDYFIKVLENDSNSALRQMLPLQNAAEWISNTKKLYEQLQIKTPYKMTLEDLEKKINKYVSRRNWFFN
ncbi:hypothetical protein ENBRE01_2338 [Enteropsectra breve]|nr:hypothetical protein ENBRE01_2338 [Enteropsectra breve]